MIVKTIFDLQSKGELVDWSTIAERTKERSYISACITRIESPAMLFSYAKIIREKSTRRMLSSTFKSCEKDLAEGCDPATVIESLQEKLFQLDRNQASTMRWLKDATEKDFTQAAGVAPGFADLNWLRLERGAMIVIGGRPSMGKTALCLKIALNVAKAKTPVLVYSLEMNFTQIVHRVASMDSKCLLKDIREGKTKRSDFEKTLQTEILVDDSGTLTPSQLRSRTRAAIQKHNIGLVVIDYLQMMSTTSNQLGEYERITEISGGIKSVAKDLDVPIIVACQLNRLLEDKGVNSKRPTMAHLRGSGAIEQDADVVLFPYRPHVYEKGKHGDSEAEIIVGKNRNGQTHDGVNVVWLKDFALFESLKPEG